MKYFFGGFLVGFLLLCLAFMFIYPPQEALLIALIGGVIYGVFCVGFRRSPFKPMTKKFEKRI